MPETTVTCPHCGRTFPIGDLLRHDIEEELRRDFDKKFAARQKALTKEFNERSEDLRKREEDIAASEKSIAERVKEKLKTEREKIEKQAAEEARESLSLEIKGKEEELRQANTKLKDARSRESEVLRLKAELDDREREIALKTQRALDHERKGLEEKVRSEESEKWEIQVRTKDEELARMKKSLEDAQRAGASGELMGEVAEKTLEDRLVAAFPDDTFEPVGRGKRGGDLLQSVQGGGSILWESKDGYAAWSNDWFPKLKRDRDAAKAMW